MEDIQIIDMLFARDENALAAMKEKYGSYCAKIAVNILGSAQDAEECVNDAYAKMWASIPPARPTDLKTFLGKTVRNLALDRYDASRAKKRGGGQTEAVLEELAQCLPSGCDTEREVDMRHLQGLLNEFLGSLKKQDAQFFVLRYWHLYMIKDIAHRYSVSESRVKMSLLRSRGRLKEFLEKEGFDV